MLGSHTKKYTLGRGEIYFDRFATGTETGEGFRYLGNTPEFGLTLETETLDHFNADAGVREKDDSVDLEVTRAGALVTDQIDLDNIALFFFGTTSTQSQSADSVTDEAITVKQGRYYQLGATTANPAGVRSVTNVVVADATPTTYTVDEDYSVDADLGIIYIIPGGDIDDDTALLVDYDTTAVSRDRVISGSTAIEGALKFVAVNPKGPNVDYYFPKVKLSPNGDYALKGEEWQQIPLSVEVLIKTGLQAIYADGRAYTPA